MEERGFCFAAEEREEFGISVALVWEPTEKGFAVINHVRKLYVGRWLHILERWKRTWGNY